MDQLSKSILLQVAFKKAADQNFEDNAELMRITDDYYQVLVALHEKYDAVQEQRSSGGYTKSTSGGGGGRSAYQEVKDGADIISIDGEDYRDLRSAKELGLLGDGNVPEFERVGDGRGFWLKKKDGSPTIMAKKVAEAGV